MYKFELKLKQTFDTSLGFLIENVISMTSKLTIFEEIWKKS